jgi:Tol biopolymer transport system component
MQLTKTEGGYPRFVTPDGKWVYFKSGLHLTFWKVATNGGEEVQVENYLSGLAFSPDGNSIAYFFRDKQDNQMRIGVRNLEDQKLVKVLRYVDNKSRPSFLVWSSDSRTLKFITYGDSKYSLWQQSLDEDQPRFIADLGSDEIGGFAVSPDGKSFAFIRGNWIHDAVLIDGLK